MALFFASITRLSVPIDEQLVVFYVICYSNPISKAFNAIIISLYGFTRCPLVASESEHRCKESDDDDDDGKFANWISCIEFDADPSRLCDDLDLTQTFETMGTGGNHIHASKYANGDLTRTTPMIEHDLYDDDLATEIAILIIGIFVLRISTYLALKLRLH